ncbi:hypothetical protein JCM10450v2_000401 [Rhodotorula kratochvilovae]
MAAPRGQPSASSSASTSRPPTALGERAPLLTSPPARSPNRRRSGINPDDQLDDSDSETAGKRTAGGARDYGARTPQSTTTDAALATLPHRLSRAASAARKQDRLARERTQWEDLATRARYYIPVLQWLPHYTLKKFVRDVTSALTLTSLLVPQSMSYATNLVHTDPVNGLFGASIPPMLYSVLGTCRQLSVGPEAALSLLTGEFIAKVIEAEEHAHGGMSVREKARIAVVITTTITFQSGLVTFLLGFFRLGFLDAVLSRALLRGFMTAVGVTIFITQLIPILGIEKGLTAAYGASSSVPEKVFYLATHLHEGHRLTLFVSGVALAALIGGRVIKKLVAKRERKFRWIKFVPEVLLVVIISTFLSHTFRWHDAGLQVLGKVSPGNVKVRIPFVGWGPYTQYITKCFGTSTVIAILGFLDSIVAAKDMASKYDYPISPNRELCALGFANLFTSLCTGALTGYGSITRSRLAASTGATTQMAGLLTGTFILLVTFFLLQLLAALPKCILAVIVLVVVFSILEEAPEDVRFFWKMRAWVDGALMLLTFVLSLFVGVEVGVIVSVCLSLVLCVKQSTAMRIKILGRVPGTSLFEPLDDDDPTSSDDGLLSSLSEEVPGVLIVRIRDGALTFANTGAMKERLRRLERYGHQRAHPSEEPRRAEASVVIFHLADVQEVDASALQIMRELVESYTARSVLIYWTQCSATVLHRLQQAGVIAASGGDAHVQPTVASALEEVHDAMLQVTGVGASAV